MFVRAAGTKSRNETNRFRPQVERLERRDNPVVMWSVDTTGDLNDVNLADGIPADVNGKASLRAAVQ